MQSILKTNKYSARYRTKMPVATTATVVDFPASSSNFQDTMSQNVAKAAQFEQRLGVLQDVLTANLKEAGDVFALYKRKKAFVTEYTVTAKQRNSLDVPMIRRAADKTLDVVHNVEWRLPDILSQLIDIKRVYDLGRRRAQVLQAELEWMAKSDFERWRSTLLGKSPLSAQQVKREWKRLLKRLALFVLFICVLPLYFLWRILNRTT